MNTCPSIEVDLHRRGLGHSVRKTVPVRLASTANCHVTTSVRLPRSLRRAKAVAVAVRGSGLTTTTRKVRVT